MVLDVDGHPPVLWVERRSLGHGPAGQHAVDLEPEVVVQPRRAVALDDEAPITGGRRSRADFACRLGRLAEIPLRAATSARRPQRLSLSKTDSRPNSCGPALKSHHAWVDRFAAQALVVAFLFDGERRSDLGPRSVESRAARQEGVSFKANPVTPSRQEHAATSRG
jgi:hypothetical protein